MTAGPWSAGVLAHGDRGQRFDGLPGGGADAAQRVGGRLAHVGIGVVFQNGDEGADRLPRVRPHVEEGGGSAAAHGRVRVLEGGGERADGALAERGKRLGGAVSDGVVGVSQCGDERPEGGLGGGAYLGQRVGGLLSGHGAAVGELLHPGGQRLALVDGFLGLARRTRQRLGREVQHQGEESQPRHDDLP